RSWKQVMARPSHGALRMGFFLTSVEADALSDVFGKAPGFGASFVPIGNSTGWLFITQDRTREMRDLLVFMISFVVGLLWGALGVAISYIAFGVLQGPM